MINQIIQIAKEAGDILLKYYKKDIKIDTKADATDYVTIADREADEFIQSKLKELFPNDKILSEENENRPDDYMGRVWMVDPLDGTKYFIKHKEDFSVMIGLCVDGKPVLGVVYAPILDDLYYAEKGKGSFLVHEGKTKKLQVNTISNFEEASCITRGVKVDKRPLDIISEDLNPKKVYERGSVGIKLGVIAKGEVEFHISSNVKTSKWDICAPQIILEEAGGIVKNLEGNDIDYIRKEVRLIESFRGSNKVLADKIQEHLNKYNLKFN